MSESKMQRKILKWCKDNKIKAWHTRFPPKGMPDIEVALDNGTTIRVELKTPKGKLSAIQKYQIEEFKKRGHSAVECRSVEQFKEIVNGYDGRCKNDAPGSGEGAE